MKLPFGSSNDVNISFTSDSIDDAVNGDFVRLGHRSVDEYKFDHAHNDFIVLKKGYSVYIFSKEELSRMKLLVYHLPQKEEKPKGPEKVAPETKNPKDMSFVERVKFILGIP